MEGQSAERTLTEQLKDTTTVEETISVDITVEQARARTFEDLGITEKHEELPDSRIDEEKFLEVMETQEVAIIDTYRSTGCHRSARSD